MSCAMQAPSSVDTECPDDPHHEKSDPDSNVEEGLNATSEPVSFPEGGLRAWRTICGVYVWLILPMLKRRAANTDPSALVQFSTFG